MHPLVRVTAAVVAAASLVGCAFHSTASHWNGRVGANGRPIFVKTSTNLAINLAVIVPFLGNTSMDDLIDETTDEVAEKNGDRLRVIQSSSENYWYGFPPFTWVITPVLTDIAVEYEPSPEELAEALRNQREADARMRERQTADHDHVVPEARRGPG